MFETDPELQDTTERPCLYYSLSSAIDIDDTLALLPLTFQLPHILTIPLLTHEDLRDQNFKGKYLVRKGNFLVT